MDDRVTEERRATLSQQLRERMQDALASRRSYRVAADGKGIERSQQDDPEAEHEGGGGE